MKSEIIETEPRTILHKRNQKEVKPSKEVNVWRGMDSKTYNYILRNRYYDDNILLRNGLGFLAALRKEKISGLPVESK